MASSKATKDQTVALKFIAEGRYHGVDEGAGNRAITAHSGSAVFVSQKKADQLLEDFPQNWEKASAKDVAASEKEAAAAPAEEAPAAAEAPKKKKK
jgi:hypothetical protein